MFIDFWNRIADHFTPDHFEGWILFVTGSIAMLRVHLLYGADFRSGLKGENGHFDAPEISLYLFFWYSPFIIMSAVWLQFVVAPEIWYFMGANLGFALLGRVYLEKVISSKLGITTTTKESKETTTTDVKPTQ